EAAWMTNVSAPRIRRWMRGYKFRVREETRASSALWKPDLPEIGDTLALSFRDLIEVRFVDYFLKAGVSWKILRQAAIHASEIVNSTHPFSTRKFKTDGKTIFAELGEMRGGRKLLDLVKKQYAISRIVAPHLYEGLEFDEESPVRWFPLKNSKRVVIDPAVAFGQPTINPEGVPTLILARAFNVEKDVERVAYWYDVPKRSVLAALNYQQRLAAA
ncbi:MAG TPA: DUF433 domain-containing protein, partial [Terriglobia bacterium]|nr:DUF433 domain-containing protein [Terriglobia bacterium]